MTKYIFCEPQRHKLI